MKANVDFVSAEIFSGNRAFFVWNKRSDDFERRNGNGRWELWETFLSDLRADLSKNPDISARERERIVAGYISAAPDYIKNAFSPTKPESKAKKFGNMLFALGLAAFFVWIIGYAAWDNLAKPTLGSLGLIEYKSKTQIR